MKTWINVRRAVTKPIYKVGLCDNENSILLKPCIKEKVCNIVVAECISDQQIIVQQVWHYSKCLQKFWIFTFCTIFATMALGCYHPNKCAKLLDSNDF